MAKKVDTSFPCKIRVIKEVIDIFPEYIPKVGMVYDAIYRNPRRIMTEFCVIDVLDKRIVLRRGEFEIVEVLEDGKAD